MLRRKRGRQPSLYLAFAEFTFACRNRFTAEQWIEALKWLSKMQEDEQKSVKERKRKYKGRKNKQQETPVVPVVKESTDSSEDFEAMRELLKRKGDNDVNT